MQESSEVREGILAFYERFSSGDPDAFAAGISGAPGVSVTGSAPGEGHSGRDEWVGAYRESIQGSGMRLQGEDPVGYAEGAVGWGTDTPAFVLPDGSRLPTRLTAVLHEEEGVWRVVHLHFSVGVPDEDAVEPPSA